MPQVINHTLSHMKGDQWLATKAEHNVCCSANLLL